jgi:hypothetical protein
MQNIIIRVIEILERMGSYAHLMLERTKSYNKINSSVHRITSHIND